MKFYMASNPTNIKEYSVRLVTHVMRDYMTDDPSQADIVMVSLCDITEIGDIAKARKFCKPILTGGMVADFPVVNELSDFTYHGEIYGLRDHFAAGGNLDDCPHVSTHANRKLDIYQGIAWGENPIIGVGGKAKYYYTSKGCPVRCKYCLIGNSRDYQVIPERLYNRAVHQAGKHIMPIAAYNPYGVPTDAAIGEALLKKYNQGEFGRGARLIRSGVEFVTPALSRGLAKGVTIDDFNLALDVSKRNNTKLILYFIGGLESQSDINTFFGLINLDYATKPVVNIVYTYIDPQPFTPFIDFDIRLKIPVDTTEIYRIANARNKRIRVMRPSQMSKSTYRTLVSRCLSQADYNHVRKLAKLTHDEMIAGCDNYPHLLGSATIDDIIDRKREAYIPDYWTPVIVDGTG